MTEIRDLLTEAIAHEAGKGHTFSYRGYTWLIQKKEDPKFSISEWKVSLEGTPMATIRETNMESAKRHFMDVLSRVTGTREFRKMVAQCLADNKGTA